MATRLQKFTPLSDYVEWAVEADKQIGDEAIEKGKTACLILAGGLGTRLGCKEKPKGTTPISVVKKKSLFQLLFERVKAAQKKYGCEIPIAILVSSFNKEATVKFLQKNRFFRLKPSQITFLEQQNCPCFDLKGNEILSAPNGNGGFYDAMLQAKLLEQWSKKGIEFLQIIPIDNPLADPCDPYLLGAMIQCKADVTLMALKRSGIKDKMGILVREKGKTIIKDYTDLPPEVLRDIKFSLGNIGHYCFRLSFLKKLRRKKIELPLHWRKTHSIRKGEKFAFDLLPYSAKTVVLCAPKELTFAPLKSKRGIGDLASVKKALLARDKIVLEEITGKKMGRGSIELSAAFLYPTEKLLRRWKGKIPPKQGYIAN